MNSVLVAGRATTIVLAALALAACTLSPTETEGPIPLAEPYSPPLSKVNVNNPTDHPVYVNLLWPQDYLQLFRVDGHTTSYLTGAIGTGPPLEIEVLTTDCEVLATLAGYPERDAAALVIVSDDGAEMHRITEGDSQWKQASPTEKCGVTIPP